jgi:hypothetical protein
MHDSTDDHHHVNHHHQPDQPRSQHVVLELGDGIGALIVHTDPALLGTEVEISPTGDDTRRSHKEVLERTTGGGSTHVLVYDSLAEGGYTLWIDGIAQARNVAITGGEIAELDWRSKSPDTAVAPARESR